jgi:hypothetical protein
VGGDYSYAYGKGEATLPDGTSSSGGGSDSYWSQVAIFPRRLELRLAPFDWMDVGGQIGWLGGGFDARVGLPATADRKLPILLAGGFDSGATGLWPDTKPTRAYWLRAEAYPLLSQNAGMRLVLAAGVDRGTFYHQLDDPTPATGGDGPPAPSVVETLRRETRLETSAGVFFWPGQGGSILFTVSPYVVLDAGPPEEAGCRNCEPFTSYKQSWGIVAVTRLVFRKGF